MPNKLTIKFNKLNKGEKDTLGEPSDIGRLKFETERFKEAS